jgi:uncharacterized protein DUF5994
MTSHSTLPLATPVVPQSYEPLRLQLSESPGRATLDGGWWPRSRDIDIEVADLVDHFPADRGQVYRVLYSRPDWDTQPHSVPVARGRLKVGSFPGDDSHMIVLRMSTRQDLRLLVVPFDHPVGKQAMTVAAGAGNRRSSAQILDQGAFDGEPGEADDHWTDEGGSWWQRPEDGPPSSRS